MASRLLVSIKSVRQRMTMPDLETVNLSIQETLEGTTQALRTALRTEFDPVSQQQDLFYRPDSEQFGGSFQEKLLLSRGLVNETINSLTVETAPRVANLNAGDAEVVGLRDTSSSLVADPGDLVSLDTKQGVVLIHDFRMLRLYARVTYDAGIAFDRNKPTELYMQQQPTMEGAPDLTFADANPDTITRSAGSWVDDNFEAGDQITISGSTSNDGTYTIATGGVSATILTLVSTDSLTAEGPTSNVTATVTSVQAVPDWLKEVATVHAMWELSSLPAMAESIRRAGTDGFRGKALRPELLGKRLQWLYDEHIRYEPEARCVII